MSDTIIITMKVTASEKTTVGSRSISRAVLARKARFDFLGFELDQLSAPLKDLVIPLLDDRYDGPITIEVEARAGDREYRNEKTVLNSRMKKMLAETLARGPSSYGLLRQEIEKRLVDVLFDEATEPVKRSLREEIKTGL